jgi:hypothetical protein
VDAPRPPRGRPDRPSRRQGAASHVGRRPYRHVPFLPRGHVAPGVDRRRSGVDAHRRDGAHGRRRGDPDQPGARGVAPRPVRR